MSASLTIARRELSAMFHLPLAYVFLVLFVATAQLPILTVFPQGQADLRLFFDFLPWCVVVFGALVTMRSWAEERQENTYEMLLTFPMRDRSLVLGKWIASTAFMGVGLCGTLMMPILMYAVGKPDTGPILGGYVGALLLASASSAAGIFFSGLTRSQLLAALLTLVCGFLSLLAGTDFVATFLDGAIPGMGLGRGVRSMIGAWPHYAVFARGVIELLDVLYFAGWTAVFLHMNTLFLGLRRIPGSWASMLTAAVLGFGSGMLGARLVSEGSAMRLDLTDDKLNTLSPGTLAIFAQARVPVQVKYYVSPSEEMPSQYKALERDVVDRLTELQVASHGKLQFSVLHFKSSNLFSTSDELAATDEEEGDDALKLDEEKKDDAKDLADKSKDGEEKKKAEEARKRAKEKEKSPERMAAAKGVKPFTVEVYEAAETSSKLIYSTLGVAYQEKDEQLIGPVVPQSLAELEYLLANNVSKLVRARPPKIALFTGEQPMDPQLKAMLKRMGQEPPEPFARVEQFLRREKYDVARTKLTAQQPMPEDYDALLVLGPTNLDERQKWELGRAIAEGRPTLIAGQKFTWDYRQQGRGILVAPQEVQPGIDDLLEPSGITLSPQVLMDANSRALNIGGMALSVPTHIWLTQGQMNKESPLTQRLSSLFFLWGSSIDLDEAKLTANGLKTTKLLSTSEKSWLIPPPTRGLTQQDIQPAGKELKVRLAAVQIEGQFKDPNDKKPRPKWAPKLEMGPDGRPIPAMPDGPETPAKLAPGRVILVGSGEMMNDSFLGGGIGNGSFLLNCVDGLVLDQNLLLVRSKQPTDRSFEKPTAGAATAWMLLTIGLAPLLVVGAGVLIAITRLGSRSRWGASHGRWQS